MMTGTAIHKWQIPLYLIIWLGLSLFVGYYHEPFSDEAQSYLIARDVSLDDLIKSVLRTEGHPLLWYLWLKIFILCGISYRYIFLSSVLPNFAGVWLFIKKAPFSPVIRYLFPLTYFIFFQYNIVARSYSLLLLFITLAAMCYPKRKTHPWLYIISLMLLGQITVYTFILASCIFMMGLYQDIQQRDINLNSIAIYGIYGLLTVALLFPNFDNQYFLFLSSGPYKIIANTIRTMTSGLITFGGYNLRNPLCLFVGSVYFICIFTKLFQLYRKEVIFLLLPVLLFSCYANKLWHEGIIILTGMFIFWQHPQKKITNDLKLMIAMLFAVQIVWSIKALITDKNEMYSPGKSVYQFLSAHNISHQQVLMLHFNATSVCPYYEDKNCTYWDWNKYMFAKSETQENVANYQAYIINQVQYKADPQKWDDMQQELDYKLKIFKPMHLVAFYNASSSETLYVYYQEVTDEK